MIAEVALVAPPRAWIDVGHAEVLLDQLGERDLGTRIAVLSDDMNARADELNGCIVEAIAHGHG